MMTKGSREGLTYLNSWYVQTSTLLLHLNAQIFVWPSDFATSDYTKMETEVMSRKNRKTKQSDAENFESRFKCLVFLWKQYDVQGRRIPELAPQQITLVCILPPGRTLISSYFSQIPPPISDFSQTQHRDDPNSS